jgi:general secretion pathway protein D
VSESGEEEAPANTEGPQPFDARFSMNRQAGIISVYAPERIHKKVESYLQETMQRVNAQVLIEAKILEVTLSDEYSGGIDWAHVGDFIGNSPIGMGFGLSQVDPLVTPTTSLVRGILNPATNPTINGRFSYSNDNTSVFIDALSRFGTVSALSSPRLTVMNNQSSVLNVAENIVYFEITAETTSTDAGSVTTFETNANTVPEGVLINVIPSIDLDKGTISMAVRPTVTRITRFVNDPNPTLASAVPPVQSPVPVVNVQEFDSILTLNNGQAIVMGGLMQDRVESEQLGVPVVSEIPVIGNLFKNQSDQVTKTELVVVLKATIVQQGNTIHATDKDLYRTFSRDRRPFKL